LDEQRYCQGCSSWFHTKCLGKPKERRRITGLLREQLITLPTAEDWMTVGSGRLVKKAKELYEQGISHDWEKVLDQK